MVMVMVGQLDRIGDQGPSSAVDDGETEEEGEDGDRATTNNNTDRRGLHEFSLKLSEGPALAQMTCGWRQKQ